MHMVVYLELRFYPHCGTLHCPSNFYLQLSQSLERSITYQQQLERERDEAEQKKEQDSVSHWESQISEIVQWLVLGFFAICNVSCELM